MSKTTDSKSGNIVLLNDIILITVRGVFTKHHSIKYNHFKLFVYSY